MGRGHPLGMDGMGCIMRIHGLAVISYRVKFCGFVLMVFCMVICLSKILGSWVHAPQVGRVEPKNLRLVLVGHFYKFNRSTTVGKVEIAGMKKLGLGPNSVGYRMGLTP